MDKVSKLITDAASTTVSVGAQLFSYARAGEPCALAKQSLKGLTGEARQSANGANTLLAYYQNALAAFKAGENPENWTEARKGRGLGKNAKPKAAPRTQVSATHAPWLPTAQAALAALSSATSAKQRATAQVAVVEALRAAVDAETMRD